MKRKSILSRVIVSLLVIAGGSLWLREIIRIRSTAGRELAAQAAELRACETNLQSIHEAWKRYQADHKGGEPPELASLFPKYLKRPEALFCPTAKRWEENRRPLERGTLKVQGKDYPASYAFRWLTSSYGIQVARFGADAPVVACLSHREAVYRAVYARRPPLDAYDEGKRAGLAREVLETPIPAVRKNGKFQPLRVEEE